MTNAAKWKEFLRWFEQEWTSLRKMENIDDALWQINLKIRLLREDHLYPHKKGEE